MSTLENLKRDLRMRTETDVVLSLGWIILPILSPILSVGAIFLMWFAPILGFALLAIGIIFGLLMIVLIYKLVQRRNKHFSRQQLFMDDMIAALKSIASKKKDGVGDKIDALERSLRETRMEETEKSAALWAILTLITGIAGLYVLYFLTKDFYKHERKEDYAITDIYALLNACGIPATAPRRMEISQPIPERSFVLYLILTIVTLGIFGIYWYYCLIEDPNRHFKYHVTLEDQLVDTISKALT
jgi:ABC-type multidrug transport system fused ATPase/permease subunit